MLKQIYTDNHLAVNGVRNGVSTMKEWLNESQMIKELYTDVQVIDVTDFQRHRDFLRCKRD